MIENDHLLCHNESVIREQRWQKIISLLEEKGSLQVAEIASFLDVSEATIRRDIVELAGQGRLRKVHGGILVNDDQYQLRDLTMNEKHQLYQEEKNRIGAYAATLIGKDDFVYLDAGTTTEALAHYISEDKATYVTNSLSVAHILVNKGFRIIMPPGEVKISTEALVGDSTVEFINQFNFTIGFFGANGVNEKNGYTTPEINEARVKQHAMAHCKKRYVLCDHSKFSLISPVSFAKFEDAVVITDEYPFKKNRNVVEVKKQ